MKASSVQEDVFQAGVIGAGGAGFPTFIKLRGSYEYVIANGAECEPLLQCDQQVMLHDANRVVEGLEIAMTATGASKGIVALKKKHTQAIPAIQKAVKASQKAIDVFTLENYYPAGDEQVLVYEVLGRIVPEGGRPADVGCLVQNVQTCVHIAAAASGRPVTERLLSVHGEVKQPKTLKVPIGTPVQTVLDACGGVKISDFVVLSGGAMMGRLIDLDSYTGKTTSGLYVLPAGHPLARKKADSLERTLKIAKFACEQCSFCTLFCPRYLLGHELYPHKILQSVGWGAQVCAETITGAYLCCECGLCGALFSCPLSLSPDRYNASLKRTMQASKIPNPHKAKVKDVRPDRSGRRISVTTLISRLGLEKYDQAAVFESYRLMPDKVCINTAEHIGQPAVPAVKMGDNVGEEQVIAKPASDTLGVPYHASISGTVTAIGKHFVQISV
ncbi:SLBB domain-containing protein [candidate division KSB1 bacterium]|nr:SLBB domain-containing protein [candidate division KSB1 bacterium]